MIEDESQGQLRQRLDTLKAEHRELDETILALSGEGASFDQLHLVRLKKRKLLLKDEIIKLESRLLPDIIA